MWEMSAVDFLIVLLLGFLSFLLHMLCGVPDAGRILPNLAEADLGALVENILCVGMFALAIWGIFRATLFIVIRSNIFVGECFGGKSQEIIEMYDRMWLPKVAREYLKAETERHLNNREKERSDCN